MDSKLTELPNLAHFPQLQEEAQSELKQMIELKQFERGGSMTRRLLSDSAFLDRMKQSDFSVSFSLAGLLWLDKVDIEINDNKSDRLVGTFLNRILGLETAKQNLLFMVLVSVSILVSY